MSRHFLKKYKLLSTNKCRNYCIKAATNCIQDISKEDCPNIHPNPYYIENGLRKVYPYDFDFTTYCKERWFNRSIIDVWCKEFALYPKEDIERRITTGRLRVNEKVVTVDYKLKNADMIRSSVHRHELAVIATTTKILHEDDEVLVVDKPSSIPVHPCGLYNHNSAINILHHSCRWKKLLIVHRIDRLTSGVLIFAKNEKKARELHAELKSRNIKKEYVCRVEGEFPDGVVICNQPLRQIYLKIGAAIVDPQGKMSVTEFQKLSFNGRSSVVLCRPHTGRTHQIRVHLQFLGYPILNDPLYNSFAFGPEKGKNGKLDKTAAQLMKDLAMEHSTQWWLENRPEKEDSNIGLDMQLMCTTLDDELLSKKYVKDDSRFRFDPNCYFCRKSFRDPKPSHLCMFLHALKYKGKKWEYSTEIPTWASINWNVM